MDESLLYGFRMAAAEQRLGVYGIRVQKKNGDSLTHFWRSDDKVNLRSAAKTFTSLAVGICADGGALKLTDRVLDFFPEYRGAAAPGSEAIEVRDLLHMCSGKTAFWFGAFDAQRMKTDWAELFFRVPVTKKPGTFFFYSNACVYLLGRIVEKAGGQNLRDFLLPRLFAPLGIESPQWHSDPWGHTLAATELYLTLDEFSRLGMLILNGGEYGGRRLVSEDYLRRMAGDTVPSDWKGCRWEECRQGYGYLVWRCAAPGTFRADGKYGQFCILLPQQETAVTITAHEEQDPYGLVRAVFEHIVSQL